MVVGSPIFGNTHMEGQNNKADEKILLTIFFGIIHLSPVQNLVVGVKPGWFFCPAHGKK